MHLAKIYMPQLVVIQRITAYLRDLAGTWTYILFHNKLQVEEVCQIVC